MTFFQKPYLYLKHLNSGNDQYQVSLIVPLNQEYASKVFEPIDQFRNDRTYTSTFTIESPGSHTSEFYENDHTVEKQANEQDYLIELYDISNTSVDPPYGICNQAFGTADKESDYVDSSRIIPPHLYLRKSGGTLQFSLLIPNDEGKLTYVTDEEHQTGNLITIIIHLNEGSGSGTGNPPIVKDYEWQNRGGILPVDLFTIEVQLKVIDIVRGRGRILEKDADPKPFIPSQK